MPIESVAREIANALSPIPKYWDGKQAILEMQAAGFPHWRQMEWIGFYFQFLCNKYLSHLLQMPGPRYGNVEFDGFLQIPWDFKAHAINTSSHQIIVNDSVAVSMGIRDYGSIGIILASGKAEYNDENRRFQQWHNALKGGISAYEMARIQRGAWSRLRKVSFALQQISFIRVTEETLAKCGAFQRNFRNSNGKPRRAKVLIDLEEIDDDIVYLIDFD